MDIAFANVISVEQPVRQNIVMLGHVFTYSQLPKRRQFGPFTFPGRGPTRCGAVFTIELIAAKGDSIGGTAFCCECEHMDAAMENPWCLSKGFKGHAFAATFRDDGMGVDAAFQGQGIATAMYERALAYAHEREWCIVPSTRLQPGGKAVWRRLLERGYTVPSPFASRLAILEP